jgi:hypothetical protein
MRLEKFRIKNYRSIIDSGDCYLASDITILAGKNESGKTAILEALEDFNLDRSIREEAINIDNGGVKPMIFLTFFIDSKGAKETLSKIGIKYDLKEDVHITVTKQYPDDYIVDFGILEGLLDSYDEEIAHAKGYIELQVDEINSIISGIPLMSRRLEVPDYSEIASYPNILRGFSESLIAQITDTKKRELFKSKVDSLIETTSKYRGFTSYWSKFRDLIWKKIPNFILFQFDELIPYRLPFNELLNNEFMKDLTKVTDLDLEKLKARLRLS